MIQEMNFPSVRHNITDNSLVNIRETGVITGTILNCPLLADRGIDTATVQYNSVSSLIEKMGTPNFKKHGQSIYNAMNWLSNGGLVEAYRLKPTENILKRIMPDGLVFSEDMVGKYANTILLVKINVDSETNEVKTIIDTVSIDMAEIKEGADLDNIKPDEGLDIPYFGANKTVILEKMNTWVKTEEITLEGEETPREFKVFPLLAFYANGHGSYGNNFSISIAPSSRYDGVYDFRCYTLSISEHYTNGGMRNIGGQMLVSLYPEAYSAYGRALFVEKVVNEYNTEIGCVFSETNYDELMFLLNGLSTGIFAKEGVPAFDNIYDMDFVFGLEKGANGLLYNDPKSASKLAYSIINYTDNKLPNLAETGVNTLKKGSDGVFALGYPNREQFIDTYFGAYFDGLVTMDVFDKTMYQTDVILDAGFSTKTKVKMASLSSTRGDCISICDTGFINSAYGISLWKDMYTANTMYNSIFTSAYTIYDKYINADINVTSSYILAGLIPKIDKGANGAVHEPFVGPRNGRFTDFKAVNFIPSSDLDKQLLFDKKVNYAERDKKGLYYNTQSTSQEKLSAMSNINNVRVLCRLVRDIDAIAKEYSQIKVTDSELNNFQKDIDSKIASYMTNNSCKTAKAVVSQSQYEKESNSCSIAIELNFWSLLQNFNVNYTIGL